MHGLLAKLPESLPMEVIISQSVALERTQPSKYCSHHVGKYPAAKVVKQLGVDMSQTNVGQVSWPFTLLEGIDDGFWARHDVPLLRIALGYAFKTLTHIQCFGRPANSLIVVTVHKILTNTVAKLLFSCSCI